MHSASSCAVAALVKYVEHMQHLTFAPASVNIIWREPNGHMVRSGVNASFPHTVRLHTWYDISLGVHCLCMHSTTSPQVIDFETIKNLELLSCSRTGAPNGSLFKAIDKTKTSVGRALLRAQVRDGVAYCDDELGSLKAPYSTSIATARLRQLLSPVNDVDTLNSRLDCVEELLGAEQVSQSATMTWTLNIAHKSILPSGTMADVLLPYRCSPNIARP